MQPREHPLPNDLATVLTILFPTGQTWVPRPIGLKEETT
jgi:hypothetical protein